MIDIVLGIEEKQVYFTLYNKGKVSLFFYRLPPIDLTLKVELRGGIKEEFKEQYEKRKHIDTFIKDDYIFEVKTSNNSYSIEDKYI